MLQLAFKVAANRPQVPLSVAGLKSTMFDADDTTWFQHAGTEEADEFNTVTGTGFGPPPFSASASRRYLPPHRQLAFPI